MANPVSLPAWSSDLSSAKRQARIRWLGRWMARICLLSSLLLVVGMLGYWLFASSADLFRQARLSADLVPELGLGARFLGFTLSMIPLAILIYGLANASYCFAGFAEGRLFSLEGADQLRRFAVAVALSSLLEPFATAALSVLLTWGEGPGSRVLQVEIGSQTLIMMIFAGTVAILAWLMAEATMITEENSQFV